MSSGLVSNGEPDNFVYQQSLPNHNFFFQDNEEYKIVLLP